MFRVLEGILKKDMKTKLFQDKTLYKDHTSRVRLILLDSNSIVSLRKRYNIVFIVEFCLCFSYITSCLFTKLDTL